MKIHPVWVYSDRAVTPRSRLRIGRAAGRRTAVVATAMALTLVGSACSSTPADSTSATTTAATSAGATSTATAATSAGATSSAQESASGLKTIDQAALQAMVDETAEELLVPGLPGAAAHAARRVRGGVRHHETRREEPAHRRHPLPDRVHHQDDDVGGDPAAGSRGQAQPRRPGDEVRPGASPTATTSRSPSCWRCAAGCTASPIHPRSPRVSTTTRPGSGSRQQLLDIAFAQPPNFAPGADYEYSNTNYVLLGLIVEKLDGQPIATVFEERFFKPLGMKDTMFPAATSNAIPEPFSHGYLYGGSSTMMNGHSAVHPRHGSRSPRRDAAAEGLHRRQPLLLLRGRSSHLHRRGPRDLDEGPVRRQGVQRRVPAHLAGQRQDHQPRQLLQLVRVRHRPAPLGHSTSSTCTAARPPATTPRPSTTRPPT